MKESDLQLEMSFLLLQKKTPNKMQTHLPNFFCVDFSEQSTIRCILKNSGAVCAHRKENIE